MKSYLYLTKEFKKKDHYLMSKDSLSKTKDNTNYKRSLVNLNDLRSINNIYANNTIFKSLNFNTLNDYLTKVKNRSGDIKLKSKSNLLDLLFHQQYHIVTSNPKRDTYIPFISIITTFHPYYRNNLLSLKDILFLSQYQNFSIIDKKLLSNLQLFLYFISSRTRNRRLFLNKRKVLNNINLAQDDKLWLRPLDSVFYSLWTYRSLTLRMKKKWFLSPDKIYSHINKSRSFYLHFVHTLMKDGKKQVSEKLMNDCFLYIKRHTLKNPFKVLKRAVLNNRISVRIQSYRKSGRNILVPVAIKLLRQYSFAIKRIVEVCDERREYDYSQRLAKELMDSYLNKGLAIRKRNDYYRLVNANKINIYFKFGR